VKNCEHDWEKIVDMGDIVSSKAIYQCKKCMKIKSEAAKEESVM